MKIKHFFNEAQLKRTDRIGLERMIMECDFIHVKDIEKIIDPLEQTSVFCLYDEYGEMCGFTNVTDFDNYIQIENLYVDCNVRRRGYGKKLLDKAIAFSKEKGYDVTFLNVAHDNINAQKFYESQRMLIDRVSSGGNMISMKRFNSGLVFGVAEIIHNLSKTMSLNEIREKLHSENGIQEIKEHFADFYKNGREKEIEKLDNRLNSRLINNTITLINDEQFPENASEEDKAKTRLCRDCYNAFKVHEKEKTNLNLTK